MPRVALIQVVYNSLRFIPTVIPTALNQTEKDTRMYVVIAGNDDSGREYIAEHFPLVHIIDPGYNVGFARGHNLIFSEVDAEYFQLINPDLIVSPDFVEKMLVPFEQLPKVGAAGGKLLKYDFERGAPTDILDSTGVCIRKSGQALDRGQHEQDSGQYDNQRALMAVSGAAAMFRRSALEDIVENNGGEHPQFFDEDFHSYFEDVDLCWRMYNRGWHIRYQPNAIAWHGRMVASSPGGYSRVFSLIRHRKEIPLAIRRLNYKNHFFLFMKNSPKWYLRFIARELLYNVYTFLIDISVLKVWPEMWRQFPGMREKRKALKRKRQISLEDAGRLLD